MDCTNSQCKTFSIPDDANFCPNCGMWLTHEGLIITLSSDPEGKRHVRGWYLPSEREQKVIDFIKKEDNKIPHNLWNKYDSTSYHTRIADLVIKAIDYKIRHKYGKVGDWIVTDQMYHRYKKSHSLLLRVGDVIYSILIVVKTDGFNIVHYEECLWQEIESKKNGYVPCHVYIELPKNEYSELSDTFSINLREIEIFHALTGKPIELPNIAKDRVISEEERMLLAIREFTKEQWLKDYRYTINANTIHIYNYNQHKHREDHYIIEVGDSWENNKIMQAQKLRSECFCTNPITGRKEGREPSFFKVNIHSDNGGTPTYNNYVCHIEKHAFGDLRTDKERIEDMYNYL